MTDWHPIDEHARGAMPYVPGVIVWLWRPKTEHAKGYSVVATHLPTRDSEWAYAAGGTPIRGWTPTHWMRLTEPDGPPTEETT